MVSLNFHDSEPSHISTHYSYELSYSCRHCVCPSIPVFPDFIPKTSWFHPSEGVQCKFFFVCYISGSHIRPFYLNYIGICLSYYNLSNICPCNTEICQIFESYKSMSSSYLCWF